MREIEIGKLYKHFKNKLYQVVDIVNDSESNNDEYYRKIVIYKALYGDGITWARDYDMFNSEVDHEKYPDVEQKYRFEEYYRDYSTGINAFVVGAIDTELEESLKEKVLGHVYITIDNEELTVVITGHRRLKYIHVMKDISYEMVYKDLNYDKVVNIILNGYRDFILDKFIRR